MNKKRTDQYNKRVKEICAKIKKLNDELIGIENVQKESFDIVKLKELEKLGFVLAEDCDWLSGEPCWEKVLSNGDRDLVMSVYIPEEREGSDSYTVDVVAYGDNTLFTRTGDLSEIKKWIDEFDINEYEWVVKLVPGFTVYANSSWEAMDLLDLEDYSFLDFARFVKKPKNDELD